MRIVSLLPSATEIVYALGLEHDLVGVTFECDHPPDPRSNRHVVVGGLDTHGLAPEVIDALVREKVAVGDDLYRLDEDLFRVCDPTHVLTQDLCRVCALPAGEIETALDRLGRDAAETTVVTLDPHTLDACSRRSRRPARCSAYPNAPQPSSPHCGTGSTRSRAPSTMATGPGSSCSNGPIPRFCRATGFPTSSPLPAATRSSPNRVAGRSRSIGGIERADPDIVVVAPCGFGLDDAADQARDVLGRLPARCAVWAIDADGLVVRPGPRVVDGVDALAAIFHPDARSAPPTSVRRIG